MTSARSMLAVLSAIVLSLASPHTAHAEQGPDSLRVGIHQMQAEEHKWDDVKLVNGVGAFVHGKAAAIAGDIPRAIAEFQKGVKKHKSAAYFNIGLAYFHAHHYTKAIQYFRKAERIRPDVKARMYRKSAMRILNEQAKAHTK